MNSINPGKMMPQTTDAPRRLTPWQRGYDLLRNLDKAFRTQRTQEVSQREWDEIKAYLRLKGVPLEQYRR